MSDNDFRVPRHRRGQSLSAESLNRLTDASRAAPIRRNFGGLTRNTPSGQTFVPHQNNSSGGGSLVYATSPNTTFDASFTYGATVPFPGDTSSNSTALTLDASFYLSTPWNTRVSAPDKLFAWWNKIGDDYYLPVETFYVKPTVTYPTSGGIGTFTCYYNDKATHSLGTNTAFPSGVTAVLDGFTNASASSDVRGYFNGKIFPASYDSENNIIYMSHPRF